jgi:UDP:flavonoid glycosyltransferase YjiC (YdhE family)
MTRIFILRKSMNWFLKLVKWFFPNRLRKTKEQESLGERILLLNRMYPGLAFAMCPECFMPIYNRNEIPTIKQLTRNEKAHKLAQQILEKKVKFPSSTIQTNRNEMRQLIENRQAEKDVPAPESRTNVGSPTTGQQTWCDKFSYIDTETSAPT